MRRAPGRRRGRARRTRRRSCWRPAAGCARRCRCWATGPVFTLNTDAVWAGAEPARRACARLGSGADGRAAAAGAAGPGAWATQGPGDFAAGRRRPADRAGRAGDLYRRADRPRPSGLAAIPEPAFSLNRLWDGMIAGGAAVRRCSIPGAGATSAGRRASRWPRRCWRRPPMFEPRPPRASSPCRPARISRDALVEGLRARHAGRAAAGLARVGDRVNTRRTGAAHARAASTRAAAAAAADRAGHRPRRSDFAVADLPPPCRRCAGGWNWCS